MPYDWFEVGNEYCVYKLGADGNRTGESLGCHPTIDDANEQIAALYASEEDMNQDEQARSLFDTFWQGLKSIFVTRQWDGSPSRWPDTESYCASCLIDVNSAAGNEEKVQSHCKLPVRNPGSDSIDPEGLQAAAGGYGVGRVNKPADVPQEAWDSAVKSAANTIISNYPRLLDRNAPDSVYQIAGKEPPTERATTRQGELLQEKLEQIRGAFNQQFNTDDNWQNWMIDATDSYAIAEFGGTKYRIPYSEQNGGIVFSPQNEWREVAVSYNERAISHDRLNESLFDAMFRLDEGYEGSDNYFINTYYDEDGMYALFTDRGKLYRYPVNIQNDNVSLGERIEVMEMHVPKMQSRTTIHQQEDGRFRWFSVSATAVLNRSGKIDSRDLFDSFIKYAEETGKYPIRMFYHQGHISSDWEMDEAAKIYRTGQADFLARDGYCYITSGLYDDTPLAQAEIRARQAEPEYWGDSIGFWPTQAPEMVEVADGIRIPVNNAGYNVEISTLPEIEAASLFTRSEVHSMGMAKNAYDAFLRLFQNDEEQANQWLADNPEALNRAIEKSEMIKRNGEGGEDGAGDGPDDTPDSQQDDAPGEDEPDSEPNGTDDEPQEFEIDDEVVGEIAQRMKEAEFITALATRLADAGNAQQEAEKRVNALEKQLGEAVKRIEAIEVDDDAKLRQRVEDLPAKLKNPTKRLVARPRTRKNGDGEPEVDDMAEWNKQKQDNKIPNY